MKNKTESEITFFSRQDFKDAIWTEKYRPENFNELIFSEKDLLRKYIKNPETIPSFIFYSESPGTGKTSCANLFAKELGCDFFKFNASDERGIDTIREGVKSLATSLSVSSNFKRCIFLDEAEGLLKNAQEAMKVIMEEYSSNCFFILACNDISQIIEPIKSRCVVFDFSKPKRTEILELLKDVDKKEDLNISQQNLMSVLETCYPDIRSMVTRLQTIKTEGINDNVLSTNEFLDFLKAINRKDISYIKTKVYVDNFDMKGFVRYFFKRLYDNYGKPEFKITLEQLFGISERLVDIEKSWTNQINREMIFLYNIIAIMKIL